MHVLITGGAGFIGSHLTDRLLANGDEVSTIDNLDEFYSPSVKRQNIAAHRFNPRFKFIPGDIRNLEAIESEIPQKIDAIVHLAARAGVRPSISDPLLYQDVNVTGTQQMLELARKRGVRQFLFASSSSVYGVSPRLPWAEEETGLRPISPYASTKVSGELLGHVYSHLHGIRFLALRFFTVYGPRQRPDLAIHKFAARILDGKSIPVFGDGSTGRDYTYVLDTVSGIEAALRYHGSDYEVLNLGSDSPVKLTELIGQIERATGRKAIIDRQPPQPGDVPNTWADISKAKKLLGYHPRTSLADGIDHFVSWLLERRGAAPVPEAACREQVAV